MYTAGETPIPSVDSKALSRSIRQRGKIDPIYVKDVEGALDVIPDVIKDGDILLTQGAGDVDQTLIKLIKMTQKKTKRK